MYKIKNIYNSGHRLVSSREIPNFGYAIEYGNLLKVSLDLWGSLHTRYLSIPEGETQSPGTFSAAQVTLECCQVRDTSGMRTLVDVPSIMRRAITTATAACR